LSSTGQVNCHQTYVFEPRDIGDAKTLACHPATTIHRQFSPGELVHAGVSEDLVRLSIGIEHGDDIIADVEQALVAAG